MTKNKLIVFLSVLVAILFVALLYLLSINNQKPKTTYNGVLPLPTVSPKTNWKVEFSAYNVSFKIPDGWGINNDAMDGNFIQINSDKIITEKFNLIQILKTPNSKNYLQIDLTDPLSSLKKIGFEPEFEDIISSIKLVSNDYLLEDWSTYENVNNFLSWDNCGAEDNQVSQNIKQKISALAKVSKKSINKVTITNTPTLGFTQSDIKQFVLCQAGSDRPLVVLPNRILWISACGTGVFEEGIDLCVQTRKEIEKLYE
jgi:hypothetical protein